MTNNQNQILIRKFNILSIHFMALETLPFPDMDEIKNPIPLETNII